MIVIVQCNVCNAEMGSIEKDFILDEDITLYQKMVTCPNGHTETTELVAPEDAGE